MSPPSSCSISTFAAARETRKEPFAITSCWRSQSWTVVSSSGFDSDSPALLTTRSSPPKASTAASTIACTASSSLTSTFTPTATSLLPMARSGLLGLVEIEVGDHHAGALGRELLGDRLADAGGGAGDQGDPGGERLRRRHPLELGLLERPVLDPELLRLVDGRVRRDALRPAHHVDRVDVELPRHAGGLLVLAEAEHPDARHEHDQRVCPADGRRVLGRVAVVVALVVLAVGLVQLLEPGSHLFRTRGAGEVEHHRLDLGAQEVVGAAGAELGQARVLGGGEEVEHDSRSR